MTISITTLGIKLFCVTNISCFKGEILIFKNWIKDGVILVKNLKLDNGILDIRYLSRVIKDKRRFYRDINILQYSIFFKKDSEVQKLTYLLNQ